MSKAEAPRAAQREIINTSGYASPDAELGSTCCLAVRLRTGEN